eukprot:8250001-Pyramimonas_sp.AAC.1
MLKRTSVCRTVSSPRSVLSVSLPRGHSWADCDIQSLGWTGTSWDSLELSRRSREGWGSERTAPKTPR